MSRDQRRRSNQAGLVSVPVASALPRNGHVSWRPRTEADLQAAVDSGLLAETHYLDMKQMIGSSEAERKNIARHLASLGIHGGSLVVGIAEDSTQRAWLLAPQPLHGLPERVDQLAAHLIDPPLFISLTEIPSGSDPSKGYLIIEVPPSSRAPHMVEGRYYGRGERTRQQLSDAEVTRLHSSRIPVDAIGHELLDAEFKRDPVSDEDRVNGHLYLIAQPLSAPPQVARGLIAGGQISLMGVMQDPAEDIGSCRMAPPRPTAAQDFIRRSQGAAMSSYAVGRAGSINPNASAPENDLLDIEFHEDGGIRVLMGRMTTFWGPADAEGVICDQLAVAYPRRLVAWAARLGEACSYRGAWVLGVHADRLRGLMSSAFVNDPYGGLGAVHSDDNTYREVTTAQHLELEEAPAQVAERLVGRLVRGLGTDHLYEPALGSLL
jgi:hypothetical protein